MKKLLLLILLFAGAVQAQIISIPDPAFKAALLSASPDNNIAWNGTANIKIDVNDDGEIDMAEAAEVITIQFQSDGISDFTGISSFVNLSYFGSYSNTAHTFPLSGMQSLTTINISGNNSSGNTEYIFSDLPALTNFTFIYADATAINISNAPLLKNVGLWDNDLTTLQLIALPALETLTANSNAIFELLISNSPNLIEVNLNSNQLAGIDITAYPLLKKLFLSGNLLTDISAWTNLNNLEELNVTGNQISDIAVSMPALKVLLCGSNDLAALNTAPYPNLRTLSVGANDISSLDLSNNPLIQQLHVSQNPIANLDVSMLEQLISFDGSSILVSELDFSGNPGLTHLNYFDNANLQFINLKNGIVGAYQYNTSAYYNLENLEYICVDEGDVIIYGLLSDPPSVATGSYCNFTPGGDYNTITGKFYFDSDGDGCDATDIVQSFAKATINDGTSTGSSFTDQDGNYVFYTEAGTFDLSAAMENPSIFTVTPATSQITFAAADNSVTTQDFCLTANGVHPDVEVVIIPTLPARPGFEAMYKIVYRNKGNQVNSGSITFNYMDDVMDFTIATPAQASQSTGQLTFNYGNLLPFESRAIEITMQVNAPTDIPAVNIEDVLDFSADITLNGSDAGPNDNSTALNQVVVGSYDPNDKKCIEGDVVGVGMIGEYLHYVINFENTGTDFAQNIIIRDEIDPLKYDINSLQMLYSSHPSDIRVSGTRVECFFKNIYLPIGGHGNILLKIKTLATLAEGDIASNRAAIFFDYNFPVDTNVAQTTFSSLSVGQNELDNVSVYPNPTNGIVNIHAINNIDGVEVYDIQGRILQRNAVGAAAYQLDLSSRQSGVYFLKVLSDNKSVILKTVKY